MRREPAGFASRATALVTDAVIFGASQAVIAWTILQVLALLGSPRSAQRLEPWVVTIGALLLALAYNVVSWSAFGRTPGKALLGLVVTTQSGERPGVIRSLARFVGYLLSTIPLGAGFLWVLVDDRRRGWHDHLAGTFVIYRSGSRGRTPPLEAGRGRPGSVGRSGDVLLRSEDQGRRDLHHSPQQEEAPQ